MVLLSAQGMVVDNIATVTFTCPNRVRDVVHNFNADGFEALPNLEYQGGRPTGDQEDRQVQAGRAQPSILDLEPGRTGRTSTPSPTAK